MAEAPRGLELARVSAWLAERLPGAKPPFDAELIAAGGSNLTYRVVDSAQTVWALRRPPVAARLATAHDMRREWRIISALRASDVAVPVPESVAYCDDVGLLGAPFYVMEFVDGRILRDIGDVADFSQADADRATESLVAVQAALHRAPPSALGLADLARRHDGYVVRQLNRWQRQIESAPNGRNLSLARAVHRRLLRHAPREQAAPALVHGDYRFDNTVLDAERRVAAVLDWELCTIGDPVADFFWSLFYWHEADDPVSFMPSPPTHSALFKSRREVAALYAKTTGLDLSGWEYFRAFSLWKMGCIIEGVGARMRQGAGGGMASPPGASHGDLAETVDRFWQAADDISSHLAP